MYRKLFQFITGPYINLQFLIVDIDQQAYYVM